ncbi:MAG: diaminopimelate epimerase [Omnitrophica WOR_2 bacterium RBG_13_44_8b]|nr:MAG: diaminopimelate epimerase [Omnitrophica WOR_2 bacterium RBG_13_44_8b]
MRKIHFTKMVASGNDFVLMESGNAGLARKICDRKYGVGADGLLVLEKSKVADVKMRLFNADGSEAEMCGNGARCVALYANKKIVYIETKAGIIESRVSKDYVKIRLTDPKHIKLDIPITINKRKIKVNFVDTGVPHAVIFVQGLENIDVAGLGRIIRYHKAFSPRGTNANFVETLSRNSLAVRTYERGVEDETLACGTGSVASSVIFALKTNTEDKILVHTRGKEVLAVYFRKKGRAFSNTWLEGKVSTVYKGVICI